MSQKRIIAFLLIAALFLGMIPATTTLVSAAESVTAAVPIFEDTSYSFEERAADLVARLSTAQKGSLMVSESSPAIAASQLGGGALNVPATKGLSSYRWWSECLHGYSKGWTGTDGSDRGSDPMQNSVSYPQSMTAGSTWNPDLYYKEGQMVSDEIRERTAKVGGKGDNSSNAKDLSFYSPTINMQRDPRWGRNEEAYSEDVLLNSTMGAAYVQGLQGMDREGNILPENNGYYKMLSTVKHYVANNSENNRLSGGATSDLRALREYYAAPYRNVIESANVSSLMTAYSTFNGEPCSASSYLMDTLVRQTYGFDGYVTSDCDSVSTLYRQNYTNPHTGKTLTTLEQAISALSAGEDLECTGGYDGGRASYSTNISKMVNSGAETDKGVFTENQVDVSLHRLLTARIKTGELDANNPYTAAAEERMKEDAVNGVQRQTQERLDTADAVLKEAVVMLKNDDNVLPLNVGTNGAFKVVIVGSRQTDMYQGVYSASVSGENTVNIQKGITDALKAVNPDVTFTYISSDKLSADNETAIKEADAVIVTGGTSMSESREDADRKSIALNSTVSSLFKKVGQLTEKPVIACLETCGAVEVKEFIDDVDALLWTSFGGLRKGIGFGTVISGATNPSGKTTSTWYYQDSDLPNIFNYNMYNTNGDNGRTYMYYGANDKSVNPVSFPFGYGLSYSTFEYSNLKVNKTALNGDDTLTVSFDVKNTSDVDGKEITEFYVATPDAAKELNRPIKRLEGFQKIELKAGETKNVTLSVAVADLAFYNEKAERFELDQGRYTVMVGSSSANLPLTKDVTVTGQATAVPAVLTAKPNQTGDAEKRIEQRLIFDKGVTVDPQLTLTLSDESIYGYIIANSKSPIKQLRSTAMPEGATFSYKSNRPSVVKVENDGTIKTVGAGVATITATVNYHGGSASCDFVVYVMSTTSLENISIDGKNIPGFQSKTYDYSVTLENSNVPEIKAITHNDDLQISYDLPKTLPGIAVVHVENKANGETADYRIGLGCAPVSTDFRKETNVPEGWHVLNASAGKLSFGKDGSVIKTEAGSFAAEQTPKNVLLQSAFGDWVGQTELTFAPEADGQQAGLVVYEDTNNSLRLTLEKAGSATVIRAYRLSGGKEAQLSSANVAIGGAVKLQIVKKGNQFTFKYCTDGSVWNQMKTTVEAAYACPQLGVYAAGEDEAEAKFAYLNIIDVNEMTPRLADLTVNGKTVLGFDKETFGYGIAVDKTDTIPEVKAIAANENHSVTISKLESNTGRVTVLVSSGAASTTYTVDFGYKPVDDYLADGDFDASVWTILNEDQKTYEVKQGAGLVLPTQRADIYQTGGKGQWKNAFVQSAMGDSWEAVAKIVYPVRPNANYQQAMFLVWQDEDNYIRLNCQTSSLTVEPLVEINGQTSSSGLVKTSLVAAEDNSVTMYLKFTKTEAGYELLVSQDGVEFESLGTVKANTVSNFTTPKLGLFASMNSGGRPIYCNFEYVAVTKLNGVYTTTGQDIKGWAAQNVMDYVKKAIGTEIGETATELPVITVPHDYTLTIVSSDENVITNDGKVIHDEDKEKNVNLTITVADKTAETATRTEQVQVKVPAYKIVKSVTATPASGIYQDTQKVTLATATANAEIRYTVDGTEPTAASTLYTGPITVEENTVIKAIGMRKGFANSLVTTFDYKIYENKLNAPVSSVASGIIKGAKEIVLTADDGADIYFTTDGTNPTAQSERYTGPITVGATMTLKAIAMQRRHEPSDVAVFNYTYVTSTGADDAGNTPATQRTDLSLAKEYEDYFRIGTFGDYNSGDWSYQGNVSSPANALKLDSQIGNSNTNSKSRQQYLATVNAINADTTLTEEEKAAKIAEAETVVVLDSRSQNNGLNQLRAIQQWNAEHPDEQRKVRGHVLAWHGGQQPNYFFCKGFYYDSSKSLDEQKVDTETMLKRLDNYINAMMKCYSEFNDIIVEWDVVNEAIDDYTGQIRNGDDYQVGQWGTVFRRRDLEGDERLRAESAWIRQAFASARKWSTEYGCGWKLFYNDFQDSNKLYEPKMSQTIKMLSWIPADDIDGYGMQGRLAYAYPTIKMIDNQINRALTETGCEYVSFTESDIRSDFIANPYYDASKPTVRVTEGVEEWPKGSGSWNMRSQSNGNTYDVSNSPVMRDPNYVDGSEPEKQKAQADFVADLMDVLIKYAKNGQVGVYQYDGTRDNRTFNNNTGCTLWDGSGNPKMSFYAAAGAPARDKLNTLLLTAPSDADSTIYSASSWAAFQTAKTDAQAVAAKRIYTEQGVKDVKNAAKTLQTAINGLEKVTPGSVSFLMKGNAGSFEILNQKSSKIVPGKGMLLTNTRETIMADSNVDDARYHNTISDMVVCNANGDWTATAKLRDVQSGSWWYGYFCFLAMQDVDNHIGFLVGDSSVDVKFEQNGVQKNIVADSSYNISSVSYFQIEKQGDSYIFRVSANGKDFNKIAEVENTGLFNVQLALDAYGSKSFTQSKTMYVEYLHVLDASNHTSLSDFELQSAAAWTMAEMGTMVVFPAGSKTAKLPTLSGYTTKFLCDDASLVAEDGTVTAPIETKQVPVCIQISNASGTYTTQPVLLKLSGMAYTIDSVIFTPAAMANVDGDLRATVTISNTSASEQTGLMILALYDGEGKMVNYGSLGKSIRAGESEVFEVGFRVPFEAGAYEGYTAKVFVWDGTSMTNTNGMPLSKAIVMPTVE